MSDVVRYSHLKGWRGYSSGAGGAFDMPIFANQDLYNRLQVPDGTAIQIAEGATEGYLDLTGLFMPVCDVLGFNPLCIDKFMINTAGLGYPMISEVISAFMGDTVTVNDNGNYFYPSYTGTAFGPIYYAEGYSNAQAGIGTTVYGSGGADIAFINVMSYASILGIEDGVEYTFNIWPKTVIEQGYINTQHFQTDDNLIRMGRVILDIWKGANDRYYWKILLKSYSLSSATTNLFHTVLDGAELEHVYDPDNPYDNKQNEGDEGGNGDYNNDDDQVDVPDLPTIDITSAGGLNLYKLTSADFAALMAYLGANDPGQAIVKWFTNPIQAIMACYMLPYPVPVKGSGEITVVGAHTGVTAFTAGQWTEWNLGAVYIPQGFGDCFLDYSPWSKVSLFLPFIGVRQLNADDVIQHTVGIKYQFDNISGACSAYVTIDGNLRYTFAGSCAVGIPISQSNWGQTYMAAATAAAGAIAGGVGAAAGAIGEGASMAEVAGSGILGAVQGGGGLSGFSAKPTISRSGAVCGAGAAIGLNKPVLFIERPDKAKIEDPKNVIGITSGRTLSLGSLTGYNMIEHVHLHGIPATGPELEEIEKLLYQGVIF